MLPPAPARLSTMTGWFSAEASCLATQRARMSLGLPGGPGARIRMVPGGYCCEGAVDICWTPTNVRSIAKAVLCIADASPTAGSAHHVSGARQMLRDFGDRNLVGDGRPGCAMRIASYNHW